MTNEAFPAVHPPATPWEALGPIAQEQVFVEGRTFLINRPADSDRLISNPLVRTTFAADDYLPYWTELWPGARMLAKVIVREAWTPGLEALEIGCGLGLPGITALAMGLRVIFSDFDATALRLATDNAKANGFSDYRTLRLDWRMPPDNLRVPVVLGSDLIYELQAVAPLVELIRRVLLPGGVCLLTDLERVPAGNLRDALTRAALGFTTRLVRAGEPGGRRIKGTLYRIQPA